MRLRWLAAGQVPRGRSGLFVALVGPDGVGKTTVARALFDRHGSPAAYCHFRPPLRGPLLEAVPEGTPQPKPHGGGLRLMGALRAARSLGLFWMGYLLTVRPCLRRGWLVVADRWGYGYWAQPTAVRFFGPQRLGAWVVRRLPRPDLVVNLSAPPEVVAARKAELSEETIAREMRVWAALPVSPLITVCTDDRSPEEIAQRILEAAASGRA